MISRYLDEKIEIDTRIRILWKSLGNERQVFFVIFGPSHYTTPMK